MAYDSTSGKGGVARGLSSTTGSSKKDPGERRRERGERREERGERREATILFASFLKSLLNFANISMTFPFSSFPVIP